MLNLVKKYQNAFSVSGYESELAEIISNDLKNVCDEISIDPVGNLIVFKKGKDSSKKLMIFAQTNADAYI